MATGSITTATYGSVTVLTESTELDIKAQAGLSSGNIDFSFFLNLDPDSTPEVQSVTVVAGELPGATAFYRVEVAGPTVTEVFVTEVTAGETVGAIAGRLARLISLHPEVEAIQSETDEETVIVKSLQPGTNGEFVLDASATLAADNSVISGAMTISTEEAASGTGKMRQVVTGRLLSTIEPSNSRRFQVQVVDLRFWNGAETPVQVSANPLATFSHPRSVDAIRADHG